MVGMIVMQRGSVSVSENVNVNESENESETENLSLESSHGSCRHHFAVTVPVTGRVASLIP